MVISFFIDITIFIKINQLFRFQNMNKRLIFLIFLLYISSLNLKAQSVYDDAKNHVCLKCHSSQIISFHNEVIGKEQKKLMNPYYIIDTTGIKTEFIKILIVLIAIHTNMLHILT